MGLLAETNIADYVVYLRAKYEENDSVFERLKEGIQSVHESIDIMRTKLQSMDEVYAEGAQKVAGAEKAQRAYAAAQKATSDATNEYINVEKSLGAIHQDVTAKTKDLQKAQEALSAAFSSGASPKSITEAQVAVRSLQSDLVKLRGATENDLLGGAGAKRGPTVGLAKMAPVDTTSLGQAQSKMEEVEQTLAQMVVQQTNAKKASESMAAAAASAGEEMTTSMRGPLAVIAPIAASVTILGSAMVLLGVRAAVSAGEFEEGLAKVVTITDYLGGQGAANFKLYNDQLLQMATEGPYGAMQLVDGLQQVAQAGYSGATALGVLQSAQDGALATGATNLAAYTDALTSIMNVFDNPLGPANTALQINPTLSPQAQQAQAQQQTTANYTDLVTASAISSKATVQDLAQVIGIAGPSAQTLGMGPKDLLSMVDALSQTGLTPRRSGPELQTLLGNMMAPNTKAGEIYQAAGIVPGQGMVANYGGIQGLLAKLSQTVTGQKGNTTFSGADQQVMANLFTVQGAALIQRLEMVSPTLQKNGTYTTYLANQENSMNHVSGITERAKAQMENNVAAQWKDAISSMGAAVIILGERFQSLSSILVGTLAAAIIGVIHGLTALIDGINAILSPFTTIGTMFQDTITVGNSFVAALGAAGAALVYFASTTTGTNAILSTYDSGGMLSGAALGITSVGDRFGTLGRTLGTKIEAMGIPMTGFAGTILSTIPTIVALGAAVFAVTQLYGSAQPQINGFIQALDNILNIKNPNAQNVAPADQHLVNLNAEAAAGGYNASHKGVTSPYPGVSLSATDIMQQSIVNAAHFGSNSSYTGLFGTGIGGGSGLLSPGNFGGSTFDQIRSLATAGGIGALGFGIPGMAVGTTLGLLGKSGALSSGNYSGSVYQQLLSNVGSGSQGERNYNLQNLTPQALASGHLSKNALSLLEGAPSVIAGSAGKPGDAQLGSMLYAQDIGPALARLKANKGTQTDISSLSFLSQTALGAQLLPNLNQTHATLYGNASTGEGLTLSQLIGQNQLRSMPTATPQERAAKQSAQDTLKKSEYLSYNEAPLRQQHLQDLQTQLQNSMSSGASPDIIKNLMQKVIQGTVTYSSTLDNGATSGPQHNAAALQAMNTAEQNMIQYFTDFANNAITKGGAMGQTFDQWYTTENTMYKQQIATLSMKGPNGKVANPNALAAAQAAQVAFHQTVANQVAQAQVSTTQAQMAKPGQSFAAQIAEQQKLTSQQIHEIKTNPQYNYKPAERAAAVSQAQTSGEIAVNKIRTDAANLSLTNAQDYSAFITAQNGSLNAQYAAQQQVNQAQQNVINLELVNAQVKAEANRKLAQTEAEQKRTHALGVQQQTISLRTAQVSTAYNNVGNPMQLVQAQQALHSANLQNIALLDNTDAIKKNIDVTKENAANTYALEQDWAKVDQLATNIVNTKIGQAQFNGASTSTMSSLYGSQAQEAIASAIHQGNKPGSPGYKQAVAAADLAKQTAQYADAAQRATSMGTFYQQQQGYAAATGQGIPAQIAFAQQGFAAQQEALNKTKGLTPEERKARQATLNTQQASQVNQLQVAGQQETVDALQALQDNLKANGASVDQQTAALQASIAAQKQLIEVNRTLDASQRSTALEKLATTATTSGNTLMIQKISEQTDLAKSQLDTLKATGASIAAQETASNAYYESQAQGIIQNKSLDANQKAAQLQSLAAQRMSDATALFQQAVAVNTASAQTQMQASAQFGQSFGAQISTTSQYYSRQAQGIAANLSVNAATRMQQTAANFVAAMNALQTIVNTEAQTNATAAQINLDAATQFGGSVAQQMQLTNASFAAQRAQVNVNRSLNPAQRANALATIQNSQEAAQQTLVNKAASDNVSAAQQFSDAVKAQGGTTNQQLSALQELLGQQLAAITANKTLTAPEAATQQAQAINTYTQQAAQIQYTAAQQQQAAAQMQFDAAKQLGMSFASQAALNQQMFASAIAAAQSNTSATPQERANEMLQANITQLTNQIQIQNTQNQLLVTTIQQNTDILKASNATLGTQAEGTMQLVAVQTSAIMADQSLNSAQKNSQIRGAQSQGFSTLMGLLESAYQMQIGVADEQMQAARSMGADSATQVAAIQNLASIQMAEAQRTNSPTAYNQALLSEVQNLQGVINDQGSRQIQGLNDIASYAKSSGASPQYVMQLQNEAAQVQYQTTMSQLQAAQQMLGSGQLEQSNANIQKIAADAGKMAAQMQSQAATTQTSAATLQMTAAKDLAASIRPLTAPKGGHTVVPALTVGAAHGTTVAQQLLPKDLKVSLPPDQVKSFTSDTTTFHQSTMLFQNEVQQYLIPQLQNFATSTAKYVTSLTSQEQLMQKSQQLSDQANSRTQAENQLTAKNQAAATTLQTASTTQQSAITTLGTHVAAFGEAAVSFSASVASMSTVAARVASPSTPASPTIPPTSATPYPVGPGAANTPSGTPSALATNPMIQSIIDQGLNNGALQGSQAASLQQMLSSGSGTNLGTVMQDLTSAYGSSLPQSLQSTIQQGLGVTPTKPSTTGSSASSSPSGASALTAGGSSSVADPLVTAALAMANSPTNTPSWAAQSNVLLQQLAAEASNPTETAAQGASVTNAMAHLTNAFTMLTTTFQNQQGLANLANTQSQEMMPSPQAMASGTAATLQLVASLQANASVTGDLNGALRQQASQAQFANQQRVAQFGMKQFSDLQSFATDMHASVAAQAELINQQASYSSQNAAALGLTPMEIANTQFQQQQQLLNQQWNTSPINFGASMQSQGVYQNANFGQTVATFGMSNGSQTAQDIANNTKRTGDLAVTMVSTLTGILGTLQQQTVNIQRQSDLQLTSGMAPTVNTSTYSTYPAAGQ